MLNWMGSLKCPDCGGNITDDEKYCPHCGTNLDAPIQKSPEDAQKYFDIAQKQYDRNIDLEDALLNCELAITYNPEFAEAYNLYGLILDADEKTDEAIEYYRKALRLNPNLEEAKANLMDAEAEHSQPITNPKTSDLDQKNIQNFEGILKKTLWLIVVLILCLGIFFFAKVILQYFEPKSTIVFKVDNSYGDVVKTIDLEQTAYILTDRSRQLGYKNISFHISSQNEIIGEVPTSLNPQEFAETIRAIGLLEFVEFGNVPQPVGATIKTDLNGEISMNSEDLVFHSIMSNDGIESAIVAKGQFKNYVIEFSMTDKGRKIFATFTSTHKGQYLGVVLDKIVISSPIINEPITAGQGAISGNFSEEEAIHLAVILQTKPLPVPLVVKRITNK